MTVRAVAHASTAAAAKHTSPTPKLTPRALPASVSAAAKDLLKLSGGNDVSAARFTASPQQLAAFAKNPAALKQWLYKTGMAISKQVPTPGGASEHSIKSLGTGASLSQKIYDAAQVPEMVPETPADLADQAKAKTDAKALAQLLHQIGGNLYAINWNNRDDTDVNIFAAFNAKTGNVGFVKLFPAI